MPSTKKDDTQGGGKPPRIKMEDKMEKDCDNCYYKLNCRLRVYYSTYVTECATRFRFCNIYKPIPETVVDIDITKEATRHLQTSIDLLNKAMGLK
jgi:hypothetical protein